MEEKELKLYKLAKFTNLEIVMESQVQSSGANQARLMEKFKKNKNAIKNQAAAMRVAYAFMFGMVAFIPVVNYFQLLGFINSGSLSFESILFAGSSIFGIFFGITEKVTNYRQAAMQSSEMALFFYKACIDHGVYFHVSPHHGFSSAHTEPDLLRALDGIEMALQQVRVAFPGKSTPIAKASE